MPDSQSHGCATIRFHGNLNDFIAPVQRNLGFIYPFKQKQSIKDACEALGVPHCEIYQLTVNENPDTLDRLLVDKCKIDLYPFNADDPSKQKQYQLLIPPFDPNQGFILDVHLGKLSRLLRSLGLDVYYDKNYQDPEIADIAARSGRLLLTRDTGLLKRKIIKYGYWVRSRKPEKQLQEIVTRFVKKFAFSLFSRCLICNRPVEKIDKNVIAHRLQPKTKKYYNDFSYCRNCDKIYWQGTHYEKMMRLLNSFLSKNDILKKNDDE